MTISTAHVSYCSNVHPGVTLDEVVRGLRHYTSPLVRRVGGDLAAGLWLPQSVIEQLTLDNRAVSVLAESLENRRQFGCHRVLIGASSLATSPVEKLQILLELHIQAAVVRCSPSR